MSARVNATRVEHAMNLHSLYLADVAAMTRPLDERLQALAERLVAIHGSLTSIRATLDAWADSSRLKLALTSSVGAAAAVRLRELRGDVARRVADVEASLGEEIIREGDIERIESLRPDEIFECRTAEVVTVLEAEAGKEQARRQAEHVAVAADREMRLKRKQAEELARRQAEELAREQAEHSARRQAEESTRRAANATASSRSGDGALTRKQRMLAVAVGSLTALVVIVDWVKSGSDSSAKPPTYSAQLSYEPPSSPAVKDSSQNMRIVAPPAPETTAESSGTRRAAALRTPPNSAASQQQFLPGGKVQAAHILVQFAGGKDSSQSRSRSAALARAHEALAKVRNGEDFGMVAAEYGDDSTSLRGGDLGVFGRGTFPRPFETVVFGLRQGEVADEVIETPYGFHVAKRIQ
jgi:parvulin-like peptidyl-prolyl isomerase